MTKRNVSSDHPDHQIEFTPSSRSIRVIVDGKTIAESDRAMVMHETGHAPTYYFPREDVRMDLMEKTHHHTH